MSAFPLLRALRAALEPALATLVLATPARARGEADGERAPRVYLAALPPKVEGPDQEFPFVLLELPSGHDQDGEHHVQANLRCGVYSREDYGEAAEENLHNLLSRVRGALLPAASEPLDSRYFLEPDDRGRLLPWERPEQQPLPYVEAWITSRWRMKGW